MTDASSTKSYRGNCHCGAFVYTIVVPEIKGIASCNCSFCSKKGVLWTSIPHPEDQFTIVKGKEGDLAVYQFGSRNLSHKSCKTCGSFLFSRWPTAPEGKTFLLNTRCLQDFDTWDMPTLEIPGNTFGEPHETPKYDGPEPSTEGIQDPQIYHGSCHCGAVKLALASEPLSEKTKAVECNCSICQRNAYLWLYPKKEQVVITGQESLTSYAHNLKIFVKTFCSHCGVPVQNVARDMSKEELDACPEGFAPYYESAKPLEPLSLRLLDGMDLSVVKPERTRGWDLIKPKYVNP